MRVLIVHNHYVQAGGEDTVVANEAALLRAHGHDVKLWTVDNSDLSSLSLRLETAVRMAHNPRFGKRLGEAIAAFAPSVVHIHNLFPIITAAAYDACRDAQVPVVQTLHNYRSICAGAMLLRDGQVCERCVGGSPYWGAVHACWRGSKFGSLAVARMIATHRKRKTWETKVDRLIALTEFAKSRFVAGGLPEDQIAVKPNFAEDPGPMSFDGRDGALFVGRLSPEKGIATLLQAWGGAATRLRVLGEGPLADQVRNAEGPNLELLGQRPREEVGQAMATSRFLVMPSQWYEGFPMVLVEAFSRGLPVIASRLGSMAEVVEDGVTGLHFAPGDAEDLAAKIQWAEANPDRIAEMGAAARRVYDTRYSADENYRQMMAIYADVGARA